MKPTAILFRADERNQLRRKLASGRGFLLFGPAGVGKSLLLNAVLPEFKETIYSDSSGSIQAVFKQTALDLLRRGDPVLIRSCGRSRSEALKQKSAASLKGVVIEALRQGRYRLVLDHLQSPSHAFAAAAREITGWADTPIIGIARSVHMEDVGQLHPFWPDKSERFELRNLTFDMARAFANEVAARDGLNAENLSEFLERVVQSSTGNPGAILAMVKMAAQPKYRADQHIKIAPLYIDFRLGWGPAAR
jgi:hypothetical protein